MRHQITPQSPCRSPLPDQVSSRDRRARSAAPRRGRAPDRDGGDRPARRRAVPPRRDLLFGRRRRRLP